MITGNDSNKLSTELVTQLNHVLKKAHNSQQKYLVEVKTQNNRTSVIQIYSKDRESTRRKVKEQLRKRGMNLLTGTGYSVTVKMFSGSNFSGLEYKVQHEGDSFKHNIVLRFKPLSVGTKSSKTKTGMVEKKENKGIVFEHDLSKDFGLYVKGGNDPKTKGIKYQTFMEEYTKVSGIDVNGLSKIIDMGALNQKRPLVFSGDDILVGGIDTNIGKTVTDLTLVDGKGKDLFLSLKFGNTVTFMNSGVTKIFPESDFRKGSFSAANAKNLLDLFGVDEEKFISVFLRAEAAAGKKVKKTSDAKETVNVTSKINKAKLHKFLKTAVGHGYWLIHLDDRGRVHHYNMTKQTMERGTAPGKVEVLYPSKTQPAKRIDVLIDTPMFELKMNIRNKSAGLFPTHIMLDYKIKH